MGDKTTRDQIVEAADRLFYRQGYEHTSFSDIAGAVRISRGNFYYHFKTKDEILDAVIDARLADTGRCWSTGRPKEKAPQDRIRSFIHILIANRADIKRYGCPVGTLCTELAKLGSSVASRGQSSCSPCFATWLRRQFTLLGRGSGRRRAGDASARPQPGRRHAGERLSRRDVHPAGGRADVQDWLTCALAAGAAQAAARAYGRATSPGSEEGKDAPMFVVLLRFSDNEERGRTVHGWPQGMDQARLR